MPLENILILTGIIAAFGLFAAVLAWGEHQTRHLVRPTPTPHHGDGTVELKKAA